MRPPSVGLITSTTWLKYVEFYTCVRVCVEKKKKKREREMDGFREEESKQEKWRQGNMARED